MNWREARTDMYYMSEPVRCTEFLQYMDKLPWCKQGDSTLVAVHFCSPEIIETLKYREVKVFPGSLPIKLNKSTVHMLERKFEENEPVPLLLVWRDKGIEMSFRIYKSADFPYDTWNNPAAAAYEREVVYIDNSELGDKAKDIYQSHLTGAKACPITVPKL